ncbi:MAG TPA: phage terminase small subunit P27 family [Bellilinea sp.]|nr:phage terminase small subunit P27 family [Bellilinea sp.]
MRGRPPKPTRIKELEGNPGHRPLNNAEPMLKPDLPSCPRHLSKEARREWRRVSKELYEAGLLTRVDRAALAAYCQAWARWVEAETELQGQSLTGTTDKGYEYPNPLLAISKAALADMRRFMSDFGMTPSSRSKVTAATEEEADPFEAWAKKKLEES